MSNQNGNQNPDPRKVSPESKQAEKQDKPVGTAKLHDTIGGVRKLPVDPRARQGAK